MNQDIITINSLNEVQHAYANAISRLGLSHFKLEVDGEKHAIDIITHPFLLLGRMALRAEETSILVFGVRIFPEACFLANNETPTGIMVSHADMLTDRQMLDKNIQEALAKPSATTGSMTIGHRELIIDASLTDTLDIDKEAKIVRIKPDNFVIHSLYRTGPRFENGAGIPIMSPEMIALSELQCMLTDDLANMAMNKARAKASELFKTFAERKQLADERNNAIREAGYDVSNT
jgi:hypothetical protein